MITVIASESSIDISGHAEYAELGKDIVCAAVTALVQMTIKSVEELMGDFPDYVMEEGKFQIDTRNLSEGSKLLVSSFLIGIQMVADEFPDYVRMSRRE